MDIDEYIKEAVTMEPEAVGKVLAELASSGDREERLASSIVVGLQEQPDEWWDKLMSVEGVIMQAPKLRLALLQKQPLFGWHRAERWTRRHYFGSPITPGGSVQRSHCGRVVKHVDDDADHDHGDPENCKFCLYAMVLDPRKKLITQLVQHREGWCATADGKDFEEGAFNVPTLCEQEVTLPWGKKSGVPTCKECRLKIMARHAAERESVST